MKLFALVLAALAWLFLSIYLMFAPLDASASVLVNDNLDTTYTVQCTNTTPEIVVAECKAQFLKVCPQGGTIHILHGSDPRVVPLVLTAIISCKRDNSI